MQGKHPLLTQHCPPNLEIFASVRFVIHPTGRSMLSFTSVTSRRVLRSFACIQSALPVTPFIRYGVTVGPSFKPQ